MADGITVDDLQIEIEASSEKATGKLNTLIASLQQIKSATSGVKESLKSIVSGINSLEKLKEIKNADNVAKQLESLKRAANGFSNNAGENLVLLGAGLKSLSGISISKTASENLTKLSEAVKNLNENGAKTLSSFSRSMTEIAQVPSMTKAINQIGKLSESMERIKGADISGIADKMKELADSMDPLAEKMKNIYDGFSSLPKNIQDFVKNYKVDQAGGKAMAASGKRKPSSEESFERKISLWEKIKGGKAPAASGKRKPSSEESFEKKISLLEKIKNAISKTIGSAEKLRGILDKDLSLQNLIPKGFEKALDSVGNGFKRLTEKAVSFAAAHPAIAAALIGMKSAAQTLWRVMKDFAKLSFSALKRGLEMVGNAAKKLTSALTDLVKKGISKAVSGMKSLIQSMGSRFTKPFTDAIKTYNKWKDALLRVAFYRAVRSAIKAMTDAIKTGIDNLYQYSKIIGTDFAPAMDQLATSALYLKNSLGAVAAPLIEAIAPAVDYLVDKFVELLNIIGKTFAALTGKDVYSQAVKYPVKYAEAAEEATEKTKEFKKFLLGIDELNIMPSQDDDTGKKKDDLMDYASMFEEVEVPIEGMDWVKDIREAIENGDWYAVGKILADKLNEIVDGWDAYGWGKKLGELINKGLMVAYGFLDNFDFEKLGGKIAGLFNGLFDEIDWDLLGRTIAAKWNALFNFIKGFAENLDWKGIGHDIATAINGFLDEFDAKNAAKAVSAFIVGIFDMINTAITETDWALLGTRLAEFINNVDWYGIIFGALSLITNGLTALKQAVSAFLDAWKWEDMAAQIYTAINDAWNSVNWYGLGETLGNLIVTALKFSVTVISGLDWPKMGRDIGAFLLGINWVEAFGGLADLIVSGINAAIGLVGGLIGRISPGITLVAQGIMDRFKDAIGKVEWSDLGQIISDGIIMALNFLIAVLENFPIEEIVQAFEEIMTGVGGELDNKVIQLIGQLAADLNEAIKAIDWAGVGRFLFDGIKNAVDALTIFIEEIDWAAVARAIVDLLAGVDWVGLAVSITNALGSLIGAAMEGLLGLIMDLPEILSVAGEIILALLAGIAVAMADVPAWLLEHVVVPFIDGIGQLPAAFMDAGKNVAEAFLNGLSNAWKSITDFLAKAIQDVKDSISGVWDMITGKGSSNTGSGNRSGGGFKTASSRVRSIMPETTAYAKGGFPSSGEMFIAKEAGPELVGKIGQKTAVANDQQIESGIANGVKDANVDVVNAVYAIGSMIVKAVEESNTDITLDGESLARGMQSYQKRLNTVQGRSLVD